MSSNKDNKKISKTKKIIKGRRIYLDKVEKYINKDISNNNLEIYNYLNTKPTINNKKHLTIIISIIIFILIIILLSIPKISFKEDNIKIRYNTNYIDKDYKAKSIIKDYTKSLIIKNNINNKKIGKYKIKYTLKFGIITITKEKNIEVIDDVKPEITLEGKDTEIVCPNKEYKELGVKAIDEYDGDLTDKLKIEKKEKEIIYSVKDKSQNKSTVTRKIIKEDKDPPKIELKGGNTINIYTGNNYNEPGFSAKDNCDGDITSKVEISGKVNTNVVGTYIINYKVKDSSNNETIIKRTIIVKKWTIIRPSAGGNGKGILYLTFDDGPNEGTTNVILDILKEEGVSATFFVTCNGPDYLIKRMNNEGHTVALHTATHNYNYVYSSINNYFNDLNKVSNRVQNITGTKSMIIRFPGGSSNTISKKISPGIMTTLTSEVKKRGYHYFDWNVDSNDAAGANTNSVYSNVVNNISLTRENVILMHDIKTTTRDALRNIIRYAKQNGYTFKKITYDTVMVTHGVNN